MDQLVRRNVAIGSKVTVTHWIQFVAFAVMGLVAAAIAAVSAFGDDKNWLLGVVMVAAAIFMGACALNIFKWMRSVRAAN